MKPTIREILKASATTMPRLGFQGILYRTNISKWDHTLNFLYLGGLLWGFASFLLINILIGSYAFLVMAFPFFVWFRAVIVAIDITESENLKRYVKKCGGKVDF